MFFFNFSVYSNPIKKNRSKQFFNFHICLPLELVEAFKPHFKKSDRLKWRQMASKIETLKNHPAKFMSFLIIFFAIYSEKLHWASFASCGVISITRHTYWKRFPNAKLAKFIVFLLAAKFLFLCKTKNSIAVFERYFILYYLKLLKTM